MLKYAFIFNLLLTLAITQNAPPKITVYGESLCPDCVNFFLPSYKEFHNNPSKNQLVESFEYLAFGNAKEYFDYSTNRYIFYCQHYENECFGNTLEVCAIDILGQEKGLDYTICLFEQVRYYSYNTNFISATETCLPDASQRKSITDCAYGEKGNHLQHVVAQKTGYHNHVPYVLVNGQYNPEYESQIINNMVGFLCWYNDLVDKVEGCSSQNLERLAQERKNFGEVQPNQCLNELKFLQ